MQVSIIQVLRLRAEKACAQTAELAAWFATRSGQAPAVLHMDQNNVSNLDRDIEQLGKQLLGGDIPVDLWRPFWVNHMFGRHRFNSDREYWEAALKHATDSNAFLNHLHALASPASGRPSAEQMTQLPASKPKDESYPKSAQEAIFAWVWKFPRYQRMAAAVILVVIFALYAVWSVMPDSSRTSLINSLSPSAPASAQVTPQKR